MKFSPTLVALTVLTCCVHLSHARRRPVFQCPPPELIDPCECYTFPRPLVKCDDVESMDIVQKALGHRFQKPLPSLQISNVHVFSLPHEAFTNISARRLVIKSSNLRRIHEDAFQGQEDTLGMLVLADDRLNDFPTEALKHLSGLRTLSLAENLLMKVEDGALKGLDNLMSLVLSDNRIFQTEQHAFSNSLETLSLARNLLTTLNRTLIHLSRLEWLFLSGNRLTSVKGELDGLQQLRYLHLSNNLISDIRDSFNHLGKLRDLNLAYNNLRDVGDSIKSLTSLHSLNLSYNYISDLDESIFRNLGNLNYLDLSGNFLMNLGPVFTPLKALRDLNLSNNDLVRLDYDCFRGMMELRKLDLSHNELTTVDSISGHQLPRIMTLQLQDNKLKSLNHGFKSLKDLQELDIRNNSLVFIKKHQLMHNKNLEILKIAGNPWSCTDHLVHVLMDLETRMIKIIGQPFCYLSENSL